MAIHHHSTVFQPRTNPVAFAPFNREAIENQIEALLCLLDEMDGDPDIEDSDEDCCSAHDDRPDQAYFGFGPGDGYPGDPEDAEEEEDVCAAHDDGCGGIYVHGHLRWGSEHDEPGVLVPIYGVDQTAAPLDKVRAQ